MGFFLKSLFIIIILTTGVALFYYTFLDYQRFKQTQNTISALPGIDSSFEYFLKYNPINPAILRPLVSEVNSTTQYRSPFPPCFSLIQDRTWTIFSRQKNLFPSHNSTMYFDRFWRIAWLGFSQKDPTYQSEGIPTFYGPFRFNELPIRGYIEHLVIGRDVEDVGGKIYISLSHSDCQVEN